MPGRSFSSPSYRYGFNGKENDNEAKGTGNQQDYGMRGYDSRIGRPYRVDPLFKQYAYLSPYQFFSNNPIWMTDLDGKEGVVYTVNQWKNSSGETVEEVETAFDVNGRTDGAMTILHNLDNGTVKTQYTPDIIVPIEKYTPMQKVGNTLNKVGEKMDNAFYAMRGDPNANPDPKFPGRGMALGASVNGEMSVGPVPVYLSTSVEAYSSSENTAGFNGSFQAAPGLGTSPPGEGSANLYFKVYHEELPTVTDGLEPSVSKATVEITTSYSFFYSSYNAAENTTSFGLQYPPKTGVEAKATTPGVQVNYTTKEKPLGNE